MNSCIAEIVGWITFVIFTAKLIYTVYLWIYSSFLGSLLGRNIKLRECGPWAVVTGATDGIGKVFATKMADAGLNIVLISRTPAKLESVAKELKAKNSSIQIKTIAVDFTSQSIYGKLKDELNGLKIGILVNNVGMMPDFGRNFESLSENEIHDLINCNVMSMARMCHIIIPQMVERKKGVVINIGSLSSAMLTPCLTTYGATKAFVDKFSLDVAGEMRHLGVTVQTVHPGYVATNLVNKKGKSSFRLPSPETVVTYILRSLGLEPRTGGYWLHKIMLAFADGINYYVPRRLLEKRIMRRMLITREESLRETKTN